MFLRPFVLGSNLGIRFRLVPAYVDRRLSVDDMVDTAGTLVKAAEVLKEKGATSVMACCTHGVLSGPAYDRVANGVLDELVISDTIPTKKNAYRDWETASSKIGRAHV